MHVARTFIVLLLSLSPIIASAECGASAAEVSALREFLAADPILMARTAINEGKTEFLGVAGYSISVPGVGEPQCLIDRALVRVIPGTTDVRCSSEHSKLINSASKFAAKYNAIVKGFLVSKGAFHCAN